MESSTISISLIADIIIIICFFSIGFTALLTIIFEAIHEIITWIRNKPQSQKRA